jgi:hypothetical protein
VAAANMTATMANDAQPDLRKELEIALLCFPFIEKLLILSIFGTTAFQAWSEAVNLLTANLEE